jgi:hypothetical protein
MLEIQTLIEAVESRAHKITSAEGPSDIFHTLLDGAALAAPRSGLYLIRKGIIKGWGTRGRDKETAEQFHRFSSDSDANWPGVLAAPDGPESAVRQESMSETVGYAVRLGGKALAIVELERGPDEAPWYPEIVSLLVRVAEIRLELDLARRKIVRLSRQESTPSVGKAQTPSAPSVPAPNESTIEPQVSQDPGPATHETGLQTAPALDTPEVDSPKHVAAKRFARLVATDIRLYNEESVMLGRKHRDLPSRLKDQIHLGAEAFQRRFPDIGLAGEEILQDAFIQVLAAGDTALFNGTA